MNKDVTKTNQSTQTNCKASAQGAQTSMHWIWVNAKWEYVILISIYRKKIQNVQKSYGQKQVVQITIMQEYCVHRTQAKYKMTENTNNGNSIV